MVTFILSAIPLLISLFFAAKLPRLACFVMLYFTLESGFMFFLNAETLSYASALTITVLLFLISPVRKNADRLLTPAAVASSACFLPFSTVLFMIFLVLSVTASIFRKKLMKYFIIFFSSALLSISLSRMYYLDAPFTAFATAMLFILALLIDPVRLEKEK